MATESWQPPLFGKPCKLCGMDIDEINKNICSECQETRTEMIRERAWEIFLMNKGISPEGAFAMAQRFTQIEEIYEPPEYSGAERKIKEWEEEGEE